MQKVLVVYSWDDATSQRRYQHHRQDPNIQAYNFEQCFALASPGQRPEAENIFSRVSMAIDSFGPDVVLMHTGAAYHREPQELISCFIRLKEVYPAALLSKIGFRENVSIDPSVGPRVS